MGRFLPMHVIKQYPPVVWVGLLGGAIIELTAGMIAPFLVLYLHDKLGGSVAMTMIVIGLQPFSEMILSIISGEVTDRFGRKRILVIALILQAAAMLGMSFAESVAAFALLYIVNGAGRSLYIPAERAIVADTVPPERQAEVFALFSTAGSVGAAIGPLLGLWIYRADPAFAFVCSALLLTMYAVAIRWKLQESLPTVAACDTISHHTQPLTMVSLRPIITMMLLTLPISLFYAQAETNLQLHLRATFDDPVSLLSWLATSKAILSILLEYWLVLRTRHISAHLLIWISYVCFAIVSLGYAFSNSVFLLIFLQLVLVFRGKHWPYATVDNGFAASASIAARSLFFALRAALGHFPIVWSLSGEYRNGILRRGMAVFMFRRPAAVRWASAVLASAEREPTWFTRQQVVAHLILLPFFVGNVLPRRTNSF